MCLCVSINLIFFTININFIHDEQTTQTNITTIDITAVCWCEIVSVLRPLLFWKSHYYVSMHFLYCIHLFQDMIASRQYTRTIALNRQLLSFQQSDFQISCTVYTKEVYMYMYRCIYLYINFIYRYLPYTYDLVIQYIGPVKFETVILHIAVTLYWTLPAQTHYLPLELLLLIHLKQYNIMYSKNILYVIHIYDNN